MSSTRDPIGVITVICPNLSCGKMITVPISARNKAMRCAHCQTAFRVPAAPAATTNEATAEAEAKQPSR